MIVLDANILVSAILGRSVPRVLRAAYARGVVLGVTEAQLAEAREVLVGKLRLSDEETELGLSRVAPFLELLGTELYEPMEQRARQRLHERGQSDWPVLAAALATGSGIWTHDRDLFGVGVPIWSSRNMQYAT